jgi:type II secretory pathway component HofQ
MLATSFVSGVVRPAAVSSRKSAFAGSSSSLNQTNTLSVRAVESRVVQIEGTFGPFSWVALFHECLGTITVH